MTQETLAEALGVTQQAVSAWLRGVTKPSPERIKRIETLLGVSATDWLDEAANVVEGGDESGPLPDVEPLEPSGTEG
jgi:transcriptional regulator with XRE-family HTH domain